MYNLNYADAKYLFEKFYPGQDYETALKDGTLLMWCSKTTPLTGADKSVRKETVLKEELKQNDPEKYTCPSFKVTTKKVSAVWRSEKCYHIFENDVLWKKMYYVFFS